MSSTDVPPSFEFVAPHPLRHGHWMTLAATLWPRRFPALPAAEPRLVAAAPDTQVRLDCHWQPERAAQPTLLLVHGLEGSSESHYMLGTAEKAWRAGFNALRLNVRNCGGTEHLPPRSTTPACRATSPLWWSTCWPPTTCRRFIWPASPWAATWS